MDQLRGKVAVVTGGASGIGRALAERFAREGMEIVLADVEADRLEQTAKEIRNDVLTVPTDVRDPAAVDALAAAAVERFGTVHVVCNNAGVSGLFGRTWATPVDDWRWVMDVNFWGPVNGMRTFVPILLAQDEGHVVNTVSIAGLQSLPGMGPYGASKGALICATQALRLELEAARSKVGASILCPGALLKTDILESERNWPGPTAAADDDPGTTTLKSLFRSAMTVSVGPEQLADAAVEGILANRYLITEDAGPVVASAASLVEIAGGAPPKGLG